VRRVIAYFILVTLLISTLTLGVTFAGNEQDKLNDVNNRINQTQKQLNEGKKRKPNSTARSKIWNRKSNPLKTKSTASKGISAKRNLKFRLFSRISPQWKKR